MKKGLGMIGGTAMRHPFLVLRMAVCIVCWLWPSLIRGIFGAAAQRLEEKNGGHPAGRLLKWTLLYVSVRAYELCMWAYSPIRRKRKPHMQRLLNLLLRFSYAQDWWLVRQFRSTLRKQGHQIRFRVIR